MSESKPLYYVVKRGRGHCVPSAKMRRNGYAGLDCGDDGKEARAKAREWYSKWLEINKTLKFPSLSSVDSGHIVFVRSPTHVSIIYMPERSSNIILPRMSHGESFESIVIVRGNRQDERYLHKTLDQFKTKIGFSLSPEVLLEMRSAARAQKIVRPVEEEAVSVSIEPIMNINPSETAARDGGIVTDNQWKAIHSILIRRTPSNQRPRPPSRATIEAIVFHLRSNESWTKLPNRMPDHAKTRVTYMTLVERGQWEEIEAVLKVPV